MKSVTVLFLCCLSCLYSCAQKPDDYIKQEQLIPMRDGTKLFTAIYIPNDSSEKHAFLLERTPYSSAPYGKDIYKSKLGPNRLFRKEHYIFVYQDVRGRHSSEGVFEEMTPATTTGNNAKTDESTDTYDTVDWLIKNIGGNNGKVGIYGISYPGFYATAALPGAHPAIKAVSPQAPVTDEFEGDDAYHRGAFFLMDNFDFMNFFDAPRTRPRQKNPSISDDIKIEDAYEFYLKMGALGNYNTRYFKEQSKIWNEYLEHDTKDQYWQHRNIRTSLKDIKPATLVVGGWFDAEDLFGALNTYQAIEKQNTGNDNKLVMGPWTHGAWESPDWNKFAGYTFNSNTSAYFQQLELDFFNYYLKGKGNFGAGEATVFVTGANAWKTFDQWPPKNTKKEQWYLSKDHALVKNAATTDGTDEYVSDPTHPVPYIDKVSGDRLSEYMGADQQFASKRSDVVYFTTGFLENDITVAGPVKTQLSASISGTDADFIVKVIDVLPDSTQQLVRAEVMRGKFRDSYEKPEPFKPGQITTVAFSLNDVAHTFKKGHKIMVQVQSSWFPLVDRNPQQFIDIPAAKDGDFKPATIKIHHTARNPSYIECVVLKEAVAGSGGKE